MEGSRKFYLTPTRIVDVDEIADAEFLPDGIPPECEPRNADARTPEFKVTFKYRPGQSKISMALSGDAAIIAWENYQRAADIERDEPAPEPRQYRVELGRLREHLKLFPDDYEVMFGNGNLEFYRTKLRGERLVQVEFSQLTHMVPDWQ